MTGRYNLLGLGRPRSTWFANVAQWATSGMLAADFAKCVSVGEVKSRLAGVQAFSAIVIEAGVSGLDRDLLDLARRNHVATIVIDTEAGASNDWQEMGADVVLPVPLTPALLLDALVNNARQIEASTQIIEQTVVDVGLDRGALVTVCGPGGTGASTIAMALAQGLTKRGAIVLCDMARNSELAMLHDSPAVLPSIEDLVDAHRTRQPESDEIRALTFGVEKRGYRLLLGQRRVGAWSAMPPTAASSALAGLCRSFSYVVTDVTADFEGEQESGSTDVLERNWLSRQSVIESQVVFVVGAPGVKGIHSLARTLRQIHKLQVDPARLVPVINHAPRRAVERTVISKTVAQLASDLGPISPPLFIPHLDIDADIHDVTPLSTRLVEPLTAAATTLLDRHWPLTLIPDVPSIVTPGSMQMKKAASQ